LKALREIKRRAQGPAFVFLAMEARGFLLATGPARLRLVLLLHETRRAAKNCVAVRGRCELDRLAAATARLSPGDLASLALGAGLLIGGDDLLADARLPPEFSFGDDDLLAGLGGSGFHGNGHGSAGLLGRSDLDGRLLGASHLNAADGCDPYLGHTRADHAEAGGRGLGEVNDSAPDEGSAVVDANFDEFAVGQIFDQNLGSERQRRMGGRHGAWIHHFAARGTRGQGAPGWRPKLFSLCGNTAQT